MNNDENLLLVDENGNIKDLISSKKITDDIQKMALEQTEKILNEELKGLALKIRESENLDESTLILKDYISRYARLYRSGSYTIY